MTNDFYKGAGFITFAAGIFLAVNMYLSTDSITSSQSEQAKEEEAAAEEPGPDEEVAATLELEISNLREELAEAQEENARLNETEEPAEEKIITFLTVESGMTTGDVTDFLVQTRLVEDESDFRDQWQESGREELLQQGTFELNSSMDYMEMIETFTSAPSED
ncbi:endolytic transglycosylase MltG [Alkalicoccus luteus]|uniref:Endolytic transglycosylase MltG n=1 Tax=Alkalicoccus luteus TaxID=1237094 RepID=A0A969TWX0_9BACI|nr:endolytic transglycosylase MltG [Alkalicoccus luteus]NJP37674.1 endolytic transglycosylase MltG [Alkalicoccus luteus]